MIIVYYTWIIFTILILQIFVRIKAGRGGSAAPKLDRFLFVEVLCIGKESEDK